MNKYKLYIGAKPLRSARAMTSRKIEDNMENKMKTCIIKDQCEELKLVAYDKY